ncbi:hypothetical protein BCR35DRAFT_302645 [Leucosporidium creatinivorum]|uniref:Ribosomal protein S16 domain-containing protein n=1 Tax=Leucosporidium creatinivorum TaxID=106004 RepID=A0A1Y2FPV8_9BASI|nr:hypothetical protein BCR35DRAFT_302645 [Leucosporidium creatinivorum]
MPVRLRLARTPLSRNAPSYSVVATLSSSRPTANPLEILGHYAPLPFLPPPPAKSPNGQLRNTAEWGPRQFVKTGSVQSPGEKMVEWNRERVQWWLERGAVPSKSVEKLLVKAGIIETQAVPKVGVKPISRLRRIREAVKAIKSPEVKL